MHIKLIQNKKQQMYSLRLYKYRDSYVLCILTVHAFGSVLHTHTLLIETHIHEISAPCTVHLMYITFNTGQYTSCTSLLIRDSTKK